MQCSWNEKDARSSGTTLWQQPEQKGIITWLRDMQMEAWTWDKLGGFKFLAFLLFFIMAKKKSLKLCTSPVLDDWKSQLEWDKSHNIHIHWIGLLYDSWKNRQSSSSMLTQLPTVRQMERHTHPKYFWHMSVIATKISLELNSQTLTYKIVPVWTALFCVL